MSRKQPANTVTVTQASLVAPQGEMPDLSLADRGRRSLAARALAAAVAVTTWLAPFQVSLQQAKQAAGVLGAGAVAVEAPAMHAGAVRQGLLRWAFDLLPVVVSFGLPEASAAPIVDPTAPVRFQPTITTTTGPGAPEGGVPVVGITTPNAAGISLNQYRSLVVDPIGLILNNSTTGGGTFLGGQVGANPNLATSGPANLVINQVTSSAPAQINGTVEIFGAPAGLVIAAPGGVYTSGAGFTNTTQVTLTTGVPQFLSATDASTSFDAAAAAGYLVEGGRIQIGNAAPGNPNGAGIEGTVGNINLIAESIGIDAALYAGDQINVVAGRQLVTPAGNGFSTTATGPNNAATNTTATNGLAIDATAFGAMTAGQITILSTAAGVGVRTDGNLAASAGNLTLDSAGNLKVANTYGKGDIGLTAAGSVHAAGNGQAEGSYTVRAGQDATLGGTLNANQAVGVVAGGSIRGAGGVQAQDAVNLAAGGSVDVDGAVSGSRITVSAAGNDGQGDIRLGGDVMSPGTIQLSAARDTTVDGSVVSASDLNLATQRNLAINGAAGSTGGNVSLTGVSGSVTTAGSVVSPGTLTVTAGTDANLGGEVLATGAVSVTAQGGSISSTGQIGSNADLTLAAAQDVAIGGQAQSAGRTSITATGGSASVNGTLTSDGDTAITAGQGVTVAGNVSSGGNAAIQASGGSATVSGALASMGNASVSAGQNVDLAGSVMTRGNLTAAAGQTLTVADLPWVGGDATLGGHDVTIGSAAGQSNAINGKLDAAAAGTLTLAGDTKATQAVLSGQTVANRGVTVTTGQLDVSGGAVRNTGAMVGDQVNVNATDLVNRGTLGGQAVAVSATSTLDNAQGLLVGAQSLSVNTGALTSNAGGTIFAGDLSRLNPATGDLTFTITGGEGSFNNAAGQLLAGNNLTLNAPNQTFDPSGSATGTLNANRTLTLSVLAIRNTGTWDVPGANVVLNATQGISNTGTIQKAGDLTLATAGTLDNSGQIVGGSNLSLSAGTLTNSGTVHANGDLALSGNTVNPGMVEALGNVSIAGGDYDNRGGTTQAGGNLNIDLAGTLNNIGSVIGANDDVHIAAASIINDRTAPVDAGSTTTLVTNDALLNSTVIGSHATTATICAGDAGCNTTYDGPPVDVTFGDLTRNPDGSVFAVRANERTYTGVEGSAVDVPMWHLGAATTSRYEMGPGVLVEREMLAIGGVPTVSRTIVKQADGTAGQIIAGGNLDISTASLSNKGGVISAGGDATLNVASLDNGRSASLLDGVTDTVNQSSLDAFMAQLAALANTTGPLVWGTPPETCYGDSCGAPPGWLAFTPKQTASGSAATAPSQSSVTERLGQAGQITAGGNLNLTGTGDLTNAGDLAAAGHIHIATPGTFTNQGFYDAGVTSTAGCVEGSQSCCERGTARVESLAWQQTPNTVAAGQSLTITAANIQNLNGTLAAQGDVSLTATSRVTNESGVIQSLNGDVSIGAPTLVNKTMDPVTLHKSYGSLNPSYAGGCNPGGSYKESQCAADETTAAGPAGVILAARDVNLSGTTLTNHGALITGGRNVTVAMAGAVDNSSLALNADWSGLWVEKTGSFSSDKRHTTSGTAVLGSLESGIQAGNVLSVTSGGQILNTGNLMGGQVDLAGAALVNGYTSPNQPTPPATEPRQVIPLGPSQAPGGTLPPATPAVDPTQPWQFSPVIVATPSAPTAGGGQSVDWHFTANLGGTPVTGPSANDDRTRYLTGSTATSVLAGVTPDDLLSQLPADLRPGSVTFYYDPYTESQKLQQAALQQTGQASFINGLAYDSQYQLSVTDQEKLILYRNAADYAKENNLALGTALTPEQVKALDAPMLWYVQQAVPDPSCNTVASTACGTVNALVPQVYLPEGYAQALTTPTGGTISGDNVNLDIAGLLRNSGVVSASDTLSVKAGSLDLSPNVVDIGKSAYRVSGGWNEMTGTVVQPGGFMSAMHMNIEADAIHAVNDALRITRADGTVDVEATNALIAQLKANLGVDYTEGTLSDDIHTHFIKEQKGFGPLGQIVAMVAAVVASIVTAGAAAAAFGATLATMSSLTLGQAMVVAALSSMAGSLASQLVNGQVDFGKIAVAGLVGAATAGLTNGITFDGTSFGVNGFDTVLKGTNSLANLAGTNTLGGVLQATKDGATSTIAQQAIGMVGTGLINATVGTVAYGGSFGKALVGSLVAQAAALGANEIGAKTESLTWENIASHAALGCAAGAASGADCQSGAIGGATAAVVSPMVGGALGIEINADRANPINQAVVVGMAMLAGGGLANALGQNGIAAAGAAQNEAANNYLSPKDRLAYEKAKRECANGVWSACAAANIYAATDQKTNDNLADGLTKCEGSGCQSLANWIQDQKTSMGCGSAGGSADCQVLDKSWQIAQAKAQGLELPMFSPDDLIGTGLVKGLVTGTLKGAGLLGMTRAVGNDAVKGLEGPLTTLYRAVSPEEYHSIMKSGQFTFGPAGSEMKQFGFNLNEVLTYANFSADYAAIVKATIPNNALYNFSVSKNIDPFIFKSGVLTVNGKKGLDLFNSVVKSVDHAY
ncbi:filamentous hemagglutinin N-terminal domain-containing protein [Cupriavidus sp. NPDC089707]|uniref:two-partner secretion domain-containing protein n=1 Tax=Cupriavidus sp. NPDC089707 TaxID=3363963 RepID=UPI003809E21A